MSALEELSALCVKVAESYGLAANAYRQLVKAIEAQWQVYKEMYIEPMMEAQNEYFSDVAETMASFASEVYIPRDPIPKTPYKPSYKTVIFDKRLKFPKCRSNCR